MNKNNRATGSCYEEQAAVFLKSINYEILQKNFRCRSGEIDLIAKDGEYLVFIEVKYRRTPGSGDPAAAVGQAKQKRIAGAARYYLLTHGFSGEIPCRFDVVSILDKDIRVIKDAFWT